MAIEFVVAAPAFLVLVLLVALGGEWVNASSEVGSAARDAARQATLEVNWNDVQPTAQTLARADLTNLCPDAAGASVTLLDDGVAVTAAAWADGAQVAEVKVTCNVNLRVFSVLGIPASQTFSDTAAAPLDPFSERTGG
jgi:Flp pilus assembly protein TadG